MFKAMHLHGALGVSNEMPFGSMWSGVPIMAVGRRPERGAQGHRGEGSAQGLQAGRRSVAVGVAAGEARGSAQEDRQHARAPRSATPERPCGDHAPFANIRVLDLAVAPAGRARGHAPRRVRRRGDARASGDGARLGAVALRQPDQARAGPARDGLVARARGDRRRRRRRPPGRRARGRRSIARAAPGATTRRSIHVWMPPHAPTGETADLPYDELLLWAWTGLAAQQPGATSDHPVASVVPIITYEQGALGACRDRGRTGRAGDAGHRARVHGVGPPRGERDEHVDPHRLPRHLPTVRRQQGRHRRVAAVPHVPLPRRRVAVRVRA